MPNKDLGSLLTKVDTILSRANEYNLTTEVVTYALLWLGEHSPSDNDTSNSFVIDALETACREWDV